MSVHLHDEITLPAITESAISGYRVFRSPTNHTRFNIVALDFSDNPLFVFKSDLTIEEASAMVEHLNQPYEIENME